MKRTTAVLVALLLLGVGVARALPGPEAGSPDFELVFANGTGDRTVFDTIQFDGSEGWDFGDREGYRCAWVEYVSNGQVLFHVDFERVTVPGQEANYIMINDRGGVEFEGNTDGKARQPSQGGGAQKPAPGPGPGAVDNCGLPAGGGAAAWDGSDHFPHHTHFHFFKNGAELLRPNVDPALGILPLHREDCALGYWTPGDEAGEAWLWWDEDGPESNGHHALDCNGGGAEPIPLVRAFVTHMAVGMGVCTHDDLDGSRCSGVTPAPGPAPSPTPAPTTSPTPPPAPSPTPSPTKGPRATSRP